MKKVFIKKLIKKTIKPINHILVKSNLLSLYRREINYVVERKDWSIKWDGVQVCKYINQQIPKCAKVTTLPFLKSDTIVHYGSQFLWEHWHEFTKIGNKTVVNFYHGDIGFDKQFEGHIKYFLEKESEIDKIVVSNSLVENRLLNWGIERKKIVKIPIGVDTKIFTPATTTEYNKYRTKLGLKCSEIVIGSFQKDGEGWQDGLEPKLIKGPDLFITIIEKISKNFDIHVLLTGPARGYVKQELAKRKIKFTHVFYEDYYKVVEAYKALDCYLMTSREEGGPKSILECASCQVPIISSNVGMAPDFFKGDSEKFLFPPDNTDLAAELFKKLFTETKLKQKLVEDLYYRVNSYDWENIARQYFDQVYHPLIKRK